MRLQDRVDSRKEWRAHMRRVKRLPRDYRLVYKEMQKYLFKAGGAELADGMEVLPGIVDLFEEGAALGKGVLEMTGPDVAAFCDALLQESRT